MHSPEPWTHLQFAHAGTLDKVNIIRDNKDISIFVAKGNTSNGIYVNINNDNAKRIAACINACSEWTTEELENHTFYKTRTFSYSGRPLAYLAPTVKAKE